jgi:hypothetical protein
VRYVSLDQPVDPTPKPPERETHLSRSDDMAIVLELPHLQPEEMREMELVLRAYLQTPQGSPTGRSGSRGHSPFPSRRWGSKPRRWRDVLPGGKGWRATKADPAG